MPQSDASALKSPLKWAGGKTRSAETLAALAPSEGYDRYLEPFCGSAAVFFALRPDEALLTDANEDLIVCLQQIAADPQGIMDVLDEWPNRKGFFNKVRKWDPERLDPLVRGARVVYLNKTAFRGLWRVNRSGGFNTPYGKYSRPYYNRETLTAASAALRKADIRHVDFREALLKAEPGHWVYLDPPYVPDREWGDFTRYTAGQFGPQDQRDLVELLEQLTRDGVSWMTTNSDTPVVRELYAGYEMRALPTRRDITLKAADRSSVDLVIANYPLPAHEALLPIE